MIASSFHPESVNYGPGYGGGYYGASGWVAGGVGFLFIVFVVFGFVLFLRGDQDKVHDSVREHGGHNHTNSLAQAEFRGEQRVRTNDIWEATQQNARRLEHLEISTARGFDASICATREGVKDLELYGDNVGFRTKDVVYPNPCAPRVEPCCEGRRRGEDERHFHSRTVTRPWVAPTTVAYTRGESERED